MREKPGLQLSGQSQENDNVRKWPTLFSGRAFFFFFFFFEGGLDVQTGEFFLFFLRGVFLGLLFW